MDPRTHFAGADDDENGGELYRLLPAVIRQRDLAAGQPLRKVLADFGSLADEIEQAIDDMYDDWFVETCRLDRLGYISDIVAYQPAVGNNASGDNKEGSTDNGIMVPYFRRDVAKTIWARKRKGTPYILGALVRSLTGWNTAVFENNRITAATQSIRFADAGNIACSPDFRAIARYGNVDRIPGLVPRIPTVRRADMKDARRGRWHPLDVVVVAWSASGAVDGTDDQDLDDAVVARLAKFVPIKSRFGVIRL